MKCLKMISVFVGFAVFLITIQGLAKDTSQLQQWEEKIKTFQHVEYKSRSDLYTQSKIILNQIEDDDRLSYQQKVGLRRQINSIELKIAQQLPELKLVGFRKTWVDPQDPKAGYMLEPEYQ